MLKFDDLSKLSIASETPLSRLHEWAQNCLDNPEYCDYVILTAAKSYLSCKTENEARAMIEKIKNQHGASNWYASTHGLKLLDNTVSVT